MAVDTREKRFSMLNFGNGNHWHATFEADGAVDLDDRQHLLDCYSGIPFGGVVPPTPIDYGVVSQGTGVTLGRGMTHMDSVGFLNVSTPLVPENET